MCNYLHEKSQPIPKSGKGWKIFRVFNKEICPLVGSYMGTQSYTYKGKNITWLDYYKGAGFCFFLTREEARKTLKAWKEEVGIYKPKDIYTIRAINYKEGLGKHEERFMTSKHIPIVAICKSFSIVKPSIMYKKKGIINRI